MSEEVMEFTYEDALAWQREEAEFFYASANPSGCTDLIPYDSSSLPKTSHTTFDDTSSPPRPNLHYRPPSGFWTPLFKVPRHSGDDELRRKFLPQIRWPIDDYPGCFRKRIPMPHLKSKLIRVLLEPDCAGYFHILRQHCKEAEDLVFYKEAISAAATFACMMISKDGLYSYAIEDRVATQVSELWTNLNANMKMACTLDEVWKNVIRRLTNRRNAKKYSMLSEPDVSNIVLQYSCRVGTLNGLDTPYKGSYPTFFSRVEQDDIYYDVKNAVTLLDSCIMLTTDEYTAFLIAIVRGICHADLDLILPVIFEFGVRHKIEARFDPDHRGYQSPQDLKIILQFLIDRFREEISEQLALVEYPLPALVLSHDESLQMQPEVSEVIEVAEIRRRALGMRFIGRDLFVWAFYNRGYGLPRKVCDSLLKQNNVDEDHAFSKICIATVKLASVLGASHVELVHLVFAIFYPSHTLNDNQVTKSVRHFKAFVKELRSDMIKRSQPSDPPYDPPYDYKALFRVLERRQRFTTWSR